MSRGESEGDICNRDGCPGVMEIEQESCYCNATSSPPCSHCENSELVCDTCSRNPEDDEPFTALDKLKSYRYERQE